MTKKIIAALLCLTCAATMLTACGDGSGSSSSSTSSGTSDLSASLQNVEIETSLIIDGEKIDTTDLDMCTLNGVNIDFDTFRYYWLGFKSQFESAGIELTADQLKEYVMFQIKEDIGIMAMGQDNGVEYTSAENQEMVDSYNQFLFNFASIEEYETWLKSMFYTDEAVQQFFYNTAYSNKAYSELFAEGGKFYVSKEDFLQLTKTDEYIRVVHVLIPYSTCAPLSEEDKEGWDELDKAKQFEKLEAAYNKLTDEEKEKVKAESKKVAEDVLKKAKDGENFFQLIADYNSDPGMVLSDRDDIASVTGYYFTKDWNFVKEFLDGSFALEVDGISDIVESKSYGYHIIKRLPIDTEYIDSNINSLLEEYNGIVFNKKYNDYLANDLKVEYSEYFDKLTLDSIE